MNDFMLCFIAGVFIGWLTKIPLLYHFYDKWEKERLEYYQLTKRVLELMKQESK